MLALVLCQRNWRADLRARRVGVVESLGSTFAKEKAKTNERDMVRGISGRVSISTVGRCASGGLLESIVALAQFPGLWDKGILYFRQV
jgi:hypothetical protein